MKRKFEGKDGAVTVGEKPMVLNWSRAWLAGAWCEVLQQWVEKEVGTYMVDEHDWKSNVHTNKRLQEQQKNQSLFSWMKKQQKESNCWLEIYANHYILWRQRGKMWRLLVNKEKFKQEHRSLPKEIPDLLRSRYQPAVVNGTVEETTIDATKDGAKVGTFSDPGMGSNVYINKDFEDTRCSDCLVKVRMGLWRRQSTHNYVSHSNRRR